MWPARWALPAAADTHGADTQQRLAQARELFEAGRKGSSASVSEAQLRFNDLLAQDPANPLYLAYLGSTYTLQARESSLPWTKIRLVNKGIDLLDQALSRLRAGEARAATATPPLTLETRLVAVATFIALPDSLFHRMAEAKRTLREALASPTLARADLGLRGHLIYEGALIAREEHDIAAERSALNQVLALEPPGIDTAELRARLSQLPGG